MRARMKTGDAELIERLKLLGELRAQPMFGGVGAYLDGVFFAIVWDGAVYFKVDDSTRTDYEHAGMPAFRPFADKAPMRGYYEVPTSVLASDRQLREWAQRSASIAKSKRKPRATAEGLRNLGRVSRAQLGRVGIRTRAELERVGSVAAFRAVERESGRRASLNLLYALEAALLDLRGNQLPLSLRRDLRAAVGRTTVQHKGTPARRGRASKLS